MIIEKKIFDIVFMHEAFEFLKGLDKKHSEKIMYNIRKTQLVHDPELFKKINDDIWEFRTIYEGLQYRLFAFWDKSNPSDTLVISTNGYVKKQNKVPKKQIQRAKMLQSIYFENKIKTSKK